MKRHPLLQRQLRRIFGAGNGITPELEAFIAQVDAAYHQFDHDRKLTEHVLEVSSQELTGANSQLMAQNRSNENLLARLRKTLSLFQAEEAAFAEPDLIRIAEEIERLVAGRQEVEKALLAAKEAADAANQAKSDFLASMSHEIRTPLNAIIGMAELLEHDSMRPDVKQCLRTIHTSGDVLLSLINDILDLSKIEAGQIEIEKVPMDLKMCVEESVNIVSSMAAEKGLRLNLSNDPNLPEAILGDALRLRQVLLNLLMNAVKFTDQGTISVATSQTVNKNGDSIVTFKVTDTGIGMSPEQQQRLFKIFSQADISTSRRYGGTGLGLAISQRLVELMGGKITVQSAPDEGSTFQFSIPFTQVIKPLAVQNVESAAFPNYTLGLRCPLKILLAEDNRVNQQVVELMLNRLGYQTVIVPNGLEVLAILERETFDLILMDIQMPQMSGLEATEKIIEMYGGRRPQIVALTANATKEDRRICIDAGMDDYLMKPIRRDRLALVIEATYERIHGMDQNV